MLAEQLRRCRMELALARAELGQVAEGALLPRRVVP
jgi:hypothetical protein